ncbi:MAG: radical SAM protein, partial [Bacillota bacterium]
MSNHKLTEVLAKVEAGERLTVDDAITLLEVKGSDLWRVIRAADERRQEVVGDAVTYVVNYNLNLTNICVNQCQFCGFSTSQQSDSAYLLSAPEIKERALEAVAEGVSEICLVSGLHPAFDLEYYAQVIAEIKSVELNLHLHGITPEELHHVLASEAPSDLEAGYDYLST